MWFILKKVIVLLFVMVLCATGCGKKSAKNVIKAFSDKVNGAKSYVLEGSMEVFSDEESFTYSLSASFMKDNYYKVEMVNQTNNHEQVLLRNADAVYVITPSLNKSFKFQSEWPYNSSQSYLLKSIADDLVNDSASTLSTDGSSVIVSSSVNYPNNPELKYQKVTFDKDGNIKKNEVYDEEDGLRMKVTFTSVSYNAKLSEDDFKLEEYMNDQDSSKTTCTDSTCKEDACSGENCEQKTGFLESIMYPLYIPSNTYLSTQDKVNTDVGNRVILTFGGEKSFVLVEEKAVASEEFEVIPVYGDPMIVNDTFGALGANSLSWTKDNVSYYLAGNDLTTFELINIGESIRGENITVSKEK